MVSFPAVAWERTHFVPGGGDACLHYVVPGARVDELKVSRSRHRVASLPPELEILGFTGAEAVQLAHHSDPVLRSALDQALGEGADAVRSADRVVVVQGTFPDPRDLGYLRDTLGIVAALLDADGLAVLDLHAIRWWSPESFRREVHARDDVDARQHVTLLRTDLPGGTWLHTRGLRKFGRPDLSVRGVDATWERAAIELMERLVWAQVRGHVIPEGQPIAMAGIREGLRCRHAGSLDGLDFNNVRVEIG